MSVSFKAKKGFIMLNINGKVTVDEDVVIIEIDLPAVVTSFISEDKIKEAFTQKATVLLTAGD